MATDHTGPCSPWAALADVRECGPCADDAAVLDPEIELWLQPASEFMWAWLGRQFQGECEDTVRPVAARRTGGSWPGGWRGSSVRDRLLYGWCSNREVALRSPVRAITQVLVDGDVVDPSAYTVMDRKFLRRIDGDSWPTCNDMNEPSTEACTFEVSYTWGRDVPDLAKRATVELVCELVQACSSSDAECRLDRRVVSVARSGLTYQLPGLADSLGEGQTGLNLVDMARAAYNPTGAHAPAYVINPDDRAMLRRRG